MLRFGRKLAMATAWTGRSAVGATLLKVIGLLCLVPIAAPLAAIAAFRRLRRVQLAAAKRADQER
jgi:hypothetical protein